MTQLRFSALPTDVVRGYQSDGVDAYGQRPQKQISDGSGIPCRHCLAEVDADEEYLILAHRPFSRLQPYAETGPIFLHAAVCERYPEVETPPPSFLTGDEMMVRGYDADERIVYGTGSIVATERLVEAAARILEDPRIAFVDLRSPGNNCFRCRVYRQCD